MSRRTTKNFGRDRSKSCKVYHPITRVLLLFLGYYIISNSIHGVMNSWSTLELLLHSDTGMMEPVEFIEVWCDLSWTYSLPSYCIDEHNRAISPCHIPNGEIYVMVVAGTFEWDVDKHYYVMYTSNYHEFMGLVEKINTGNYYCEVNKYNLTQTHLTGLIG